MGGFTHLNTHSCFSLMRGVPRPEELCRAARAAGMDRIALTDTNGLYGLIWFLQEAKAAGVRPIVGAEVLDPRTGAKAVVLAKKKHAYPALCHLISQRHTDPLFSLQEGLRNLGEEDGLAVLTAEREILSTLCGRKNLYCEIKTRVGSHGLAKWAQQRGISPLATGDVHFLTPDQHPLHRLLRAIDTCTTLQSVPDSEVVSPDLWFKTEEFYREEYPHLPGAVDNAASLASECETDWSFGKLVFPHLKTDCGDPLHVLTEKCEANIPLRYGRNTPEIRRRLEKELSIIGPKGFASIFLIVADIVQHAALTCGRGSAAASLVSYLLFITHVDPIAHDLFFERFLNEGRVDPPDIDVDFPWDERDDVLDYIFQKYGERDAAMVANHTGFQAAGALREVAKVYGLPDEEISRVTKRLRGLWYAGGATPDLVKSHPLFKDVELTDPWPEILVTALQLEGRPRHLSVHCGGVVLAPGGIRRYAPVQIAPKGVPILQWEKDQTEDAGLVKIDILGNRSLAVIRDALLAVREHGGKSISYKKLNPLSDEKTQALLARGDTVGVFYVESPAMRQLQIKTGKGDFEHLVIHSSIIRPAANEYIREYVRRLRGGDWQPLHPLLAKIMNGTFGIMVYQEDVSRVAMALAGFDAAKADGLRKILSKKTKRKLEEMRAEFFSGASRRGVDEVAIQAVWDMIMSFSGYSFCKPHSASYALVSFKSSWLKAHHPAEFMAAVISNQGGYYSTFAYLSECRRMGLGVLPPCVNESRRHYTGENRQVRIGLMQVGGLSDAAIAAVEETRKARSYRNLEDFLSRVDTDPSDVRLLIKAGCFDSIACGMSRPDMMWRVHEWAASKSPKGRGQLNLLSLFDAPETKATDNENGKKAPMPATEQYDARTMLTHEVETLGFLASRHPLELYRGQLARQKTIPAKDLPKYAGRHVSVAGWYVTGKVISAKGGNPMEFVSFEDTTALFETVFFPKAYKRFCHMLSRVRPYILSGKVQEDFGAYTLSVENVRWL